MMTTLITKYPVILPYDSVKTHEPEFQFFHSGFSKDEIAALFSAKNRIIIRSLNNHLIPTYNLLTKFLHTNQEVTNAFMKMQFYSVNLTDFQILAEANIKVLRDHKVPEHLTRILLVRHPAALNLKNDHFKKIVRTIEGMKFDPHTTVFVEAIGIMGRTSNLEWEKRVGAYKSFGWSDWDVIAAFKLQPYCMTVSETKIRKVMGFYLNELGLKTSDVSNHPYLMLISLKKRVIPRCSVLLVLLENGLIGKDFNFVSALYQGNKRFETKFVLKFQEIAPELLKAYRGESELPRLETLREMLKSAD